MFWSIITFLLVLSILVLVHEFGHYIVAKKNGIWVEEFGFGLPPRIFGKKVGETIYSINLLPFGGFVRLHGEMTDDGVTKPNRAFLGKSLWVKTGVVVAGVVMNFLLSIVVFSIVHFNVGIPREKGYVEIAGIVPNSPASNNSELIVGKVIYSIDGKEVKSITDITSTTKLGGKHVLRVGNVRAEDKDIKKVTVDTKFNKEENVWLLGLFLNSQEVYYPPVWQRPFYGAYYGLKSSLSWTNVIFNSFKDVAKDASNGKVPENISGPVGIFSIIYKVVQERDIIALLNLIGIISINLSILNGGRLLFIMIEAIFGKKVAPKIESVIHSIGMFILLGLILLITISDVKKLIMAGSISNFINSFTK